MSVKYLAVLLLSVCSLTVSAQKKKKAVAPKPAKKTLATAASSTAEWFPTKTGTRFYVLSGPTKDTLSLGQFEPKAAEPTEVTLTEFTAKGVKLIAVSWKENTLIKTDKRTETGLSVQTRIFDPVSKTAVLENTQSTVNISEIVSLGGTDATKTVQKVRSEGSECKLLPDGDVTLTNKGRSDRLSYDPKQGKYVVAKKK
ncbi:MULTISPECIES: hypothetical protein [unclassified Flavobacterium]|uniref:hypothetical protein n=1 Tax=unclassified Flavobacterium TaxID=196869 RepID=UPI001F133175|nr:MULTISPECIES: hypothetical protein [unclassified Flavobacterium]UMY65267.1 hypothetical protein MKO97_12255 [Flavobacterium sp. HJ-32-4]